MKKLLLSIISLFMFSFAMAQEDRGYLVSVGDVAPDIDLILEDGSKTKLSDLKGKVVMIQFTATWCGVCLGEMPHIESDIWKEFSANDEFALYGVMLKQKATDVPKMRELTGVTYPLALDTKGDAFYKYAKQGAGVTRNVIIDRDGKIIFQTRLYDEAEFKDMIGVIKDELAKK